MSAVSPAVSIEPHAGDATRQALRPVIASLTFSLPVVALLAWGAFRYRTDLVRSWRELLVWAAAIALLNLLDIPAWNGRHLSPGLPLGIALSLLATPVGAGLVAFVATTDRRELRRSIFWSRALFNRSQHALAVSAASAGAMSVHHSQSFDSLLLPTLLSLVLQTSVNYLAVGVVTALTERRKVRSSLSSLLVGSPLDFAFIWMAWGVTGYLLLVARQSMGPWALVTFSGLALVGRQALVRSEAGRLSRQQLQERERDMRALERRINTERDNERRAMAAHLHDELLPPLYQASLLSHVVRQDLATGRLLELEDDLPPLTRACDSASELLRDVIRELRQRSVPRSAGATLERLATEVQTLWRIRVRVDVHDLGEVGRHVEIALYQVCKEALLNAAIHSGGSSATLRVARDDEYVRFSVEDDGTGFDTSTVAENHFGLLIMRERVESLGGLLHIDSRPGEGTIVAGRLPPE